MTTHVITIDLDLDAQSSNEIANVLAEHGFKPQGKVYFGDVNAVTCVMAIMDVTKRCSWFASSVGNVRMLRIEEENDMMPAVRQAAGISQPKTKHIKGVLEADTVLRLLNLP